MGTNHLRHHFCKRTRWRNKRRCIRRKRDFVTHILTRCNMVKMRCQHGFQAIYRMGGIKADIKLARCLFGYHVRCRIFNYQINNLRCAWHELFSTVIQFCSVHHSQHLKQGRHRAFCQMRIGNMPLTSGHAQPACQRAAPSMLYHITKRRGVGWLADNTEIRLVTICLHPVNHLYRAINRISFFITCDDQANRPCWGIICQKGF